MPILSIVDYDKIRTMLGDTAIEDDTIAVFAGSADREVKRLVTGWASLTGDDLASLKQATAYLTAARVALATPRVTKVAGLGYTEEGTPVSADTLRALAYAELEGLGVTLTQSYGFSVRPTRTDGYADLEAAR